MLYIQEVSRHGVQVVEVHLYTKTNMKFNKVIKSYELIRMKMNFVYKKSSESVITFLILYVDDILLIWNNICILSLKKAWLSKNSMNDLGEETYRVGICICGKRLSWLLGLPQSMYIETIVKRFSKENFKK